ncbi:MAG: hypothetical protein ISR62_02740 [Desulfobacteraceae bacterium]|nr:hypothetical protein [Desulfobacteraceae bacterium]
MGRFVKKKVAGARRNIRDVRNRGRIEAESSKLKDRSSKGEEGRVKDRGHP